MNRTEYDEYITKRDPPSKLSSLVTVQKNPHPLPPHVKEYISNGKGLDPILQSSPLLIPQTPLRVRPRITLKQLHPLHNLPFRVRPLHVFVLRPTASFDICLERQIVPIAPRCGSEGFDAECGTLFVPSRCSL